MSDVKISEFVKSLAAAMNVTVEDGKVKVGNKNAYKEALPEALERHGAWTAFDKKAPGILKKDTSVEEKMVELKAVLADSSVDVAKAMNATTGEMYAAVSLAVGEAAQAFIKKNKDVNRVTGTINTVGNDRFKVVYDHAKKTTITNQQTRETSVKDVYGACVVKHVESGGKEAAEQLTAVRGHLAAAAQKALSK